ncbi:polyphosphate kinase 2 family protein [Massilia sp. PAMC28688]|uniref:PPK2 family polyphosphate kinase n=1 Tax=Massilia sp. PAMC28688 TaxID=2861283 RepID=UPI001C631782|nr:PPK2 family polyphosphate kinase [Massilia sp. PAMC28688]QYF95157.1 polyphosphate kinase 2 family protein [Massilia sp. PAMC28688]
MPAPLRERLRAGPQLRLRDDDAARTPLRARDGRDKRSRHDIKQAERDATAGLTEQIARLQEMLFAQRRRKVLIVLQGMDTSGKDGLVRSLYSRLNPMGVRAVQFKAPNDVEAAHDFLWRVHQQVPVAGEIAVFNRSHYEDVLVPRVQHQIDEPECRRRLAHIRDFERMLAETGTVIVKLFLHISSDEQRKRLQARLADPEKQWKFDENDIVQRKRWDEYRQAYEEAIVATDAEHAPWYIIPADAKTHRNLLVSTLLLEILGALELAYPAPDQELARLTIS